MSDTFCHDAWLLALGGQVADHDYGILDIVMASYNQLIRSGLGIGQKNK